MSDMNKINIVPQIIWQRIIVATAFISWSTVMFLVGNIAPEFGLSQAQAESPKLIVRLDRDRLAGKNLGEFEPYEPEHGDLIARGYEYFYSEDENFGIGVWESKPGKIRYTDLEYDELMYVLDGAMVMTDEHGNSETYGTGEGLVLPKGWTGTLAVPEGGVRKIWVSYMGGKKGESK
jgi:uncharacterized cupin superfamily protein